MIAMSSPAFLDLMLRKASGEKVEDIELTRALMTDPKVTGPLVRALIQSGQITPTSTAQIDEVASSVLHILRA